MQEEWPLALDREAYKWRASQPRANLLLQHGYGEYAGRFLRQYNELIPRLLERGFNVYAFDLEGHGNSPGSRGMTDIEQAVQEHLTARLALAEESLPLFLFGHSLGGLVTASSMVLDANGVAGVVLSSPALPLHNVMLRLLARTLAAIAPGAPAPLHPNDRSLLSRLPEVAEQALQDPMMYQGSLTNRVAAMALMRAHANRSLYPQWRTPTLILHGSEDRVTDPEGSRRFHKAIQSKDKTLHLIEGAYHELLNDRGRDDSLKIILDWLCERLP